MFIDPNQLIGPTIMVDRNTGETWEHEPAAGSHIQATNAAWWSRPAVRRRCTTADARARRSMVRSIGVTRITAAAAKLAAGGFESKTTGGCVHPSPNGGFYRYATSESAQPAICA